MNKILLKLFIVSFLFFAFTAEACNLADQIEELRKQTAALNDLNRSFGQNPFDVFGVQPGLGRKGQKPKHSEFIGLPKELHGKALVHVKCDCDDLASFGHYCMSHALTHALTDAVTYDGSRLAGNPSELVKASFNKFKFFSNEDRTFSGNLMMVASDLKLDAIYLTFENNLIQAYSGQGTSAALLALQSLNALYRDIKKASSKPFVKPIFFCHDEHVALFSVIWDGKQVSIVFSDNLNKPIEVGSPLYCAAQFITGYFAENEYQFMIDLVSDLATTNQGPYRERFKELRAINGKKEAYLLLNEIFERWPLRLQAKFRDDIELSKLNQPIKLLKRLFLLGGSLSVKSLIIRTYDAMLDAIENSADDNKLRLERAAKVMEALKKSSREQCIFSLSKDKEAAAVFARAEALRTSLNAY